MHCVPQGEMGRTRGVGMTKFKMSKADLHNEVHLCCLHQVPAAAMPPPPPVSPTGPCFYCRVLIRGTPIHGSMRRAGLMILR